MCTHTAYRNVEKVDYWSGIRCEAEVEESREFLGRKGEAKKHPKCGEELKQSMGLQESHFLLSTWKSSDLVWF